MERLSEWLYKVSSGWVMLLSLIIFFGFTAVVLPMQAEETARNAGDAGSPDMSFIYSTEDLYSMAEAYGDDGRDAYIRTRFTFDIVWPIVYTLFLCTSISWIFQKVFTPQIWLWRMNLLPFVAALFDYFENIAASIVMFRYPMQTPILDFLAPVFTFLKWLSMSGAFMVLLLGILFIAWKSLSKS